MPPKIAVVVDCTAAAESPDAVVAAVCRVIGNYVSAATRNNEAASDVEWGWKFTAETSAKPNKAAFESFSGETLKTFCTELASAIYTCKDAAKPATTLSQLYEAIVDSIGSFDWGTQSLSKKSTSSSTRSGKGKCPKSHRTNCLFIISRCPTSAASLAEAVNLRSKPVGNKRLTKAISDELFKGALKQECFKKDVAIHWVDLPHKLNSCEDFVGQECIAAVLDSEFDGAYLPAIAVSKSNTMLGIHVGLNQWLDKGSGSDATASFTLPVCTSVARSKHLQKNPCCLLHIVQHCVEEISSETVQAARNPGKIHEKKSHFNSGNAIHVRGTVTDGNVRNISWDKSKAYTAIGLCAREEIANNALRSEKNESSKALPSLTSARLSEWFRALMISLQKSGCHLVVDFIDPITQDTVVGLLSPIGPHCARLVGLNEEKKQQQPNLLDLTSEPDDVDNKCHCGVTIDIPPECNCDSATTRTRASLVCTLSDVQSIFSDDAWAKDTKSKDQDAISALGPSRDTIRKNSELRSSCDELIMQFCKQRTCNGIPQGRESSPEKKSQQRKSHETRQGPQHTSWLKEQCINLISQPDQPNASDLAFTKVCDLWPNLKNSPKKKRKIQQACKDIEDVREDIEVLMGQDYEAVDGTTNIIRRYQIQIILRLHLIALKGTDLDASQIKDEESDDTDDDGNGRCTTVEHSEINCLATSLALKMDPSVNVNSEGIKSFYDDVILPFFCEKIPITLYQMYTRSGVPHPEKLRKYGAPIDAADIENGSEDRAQVSSDGQRASSPFFMDRSNHNQHYASSSDAHMSSPSALSLKVDPVDAAKAKVEQLSSRQIAFAVPKKQKRHKIPSRGLRRSPRTKVKQIAAKNLAAAIKKGGQKLLSVAETPAKELAKKALRNSKLNIPRGRTHAFVSESPAVHAEKAKARGLRRSPRNPTSGQRSLLSGLAGSSLGTTLRRSPRSHSKRLASDDEVAATPRKAAKRALDL